MTHSDITLKEAFELVGHPEAFSKFLYNKEHMRSYDDSDSDSSNGIHAQELFSAFDWSHSPEHSSYWNKIYTELKILNKKLQNINSPSLELRNALVAIGKEEAIVKFILNSINTSSTKSVSKDSIFEEITYSFSWKDSPEGTDYWNDIYLALREKNSEKETSQTIIKLPIEAFRNVIIPENYTRKTDGIIDENDFLWCAKSQTFFKSSETYKGKNCKDAICVIRPNNINEKLPRGFYPDFAS
jgi:hypothetical protein